MNNLINTSNIAGLQINNLARELPSAQPHYNNVSPPMMTKVAIEGETDMILTKYDV